MGEPLLLDLVPRRVMPWLEQLLGEGQVQQPVDGASADPTRNTGQSGGTVVRGICEPLFVGAVPVGGRGLTGTGWWWRAHRLADGRLPQPPGEQRVPVAEQTSGGHVDTQPAHVIVTAHLHSLSPSCGGTLLFPGSHRLLHARNPLFSHLMAATAFRPWEDKTWEGHPYARCVWASPQLESDYQVWHAGRAHHVCSACLLQLCVLTAGVRLTRRCCLAQAVRQWVTRHLCPVEFCGGEGDVVLWHARCFHAASRNFSGAAGASSAPEIRQAVFYDCHRADMLSADYQRGDRSITDQSMWAEWSPEIQAVSADIESEAGIIKAVNAVKAASVPRL
jgi:hypothetical protein